jgi:hypothetical protein
MAAASPAKAWAPSPLAEPTSLLGARQQPPPPTRTSISPSYGSPRSSLLVSSPSRAGQPAPPCPSPSMGASSTSPALDAAQKLLLAGAQQQLQALLGAPPSGLCAGTSHGRRAPVHGVPPPRSTSPWSSSPCTFPFFSMALLFPSRAAPCWFSTPPTAWSPSRHSRSLSP